MKPEKIRGQSFPAAEELMRAQDMITSLQFEDVDKVVTQLLKDLPNGVIIQSTCSKCEEEAMTKEIVELDQQDYFELIKEFKIEMPPEIEKALGPARKEFVILHTQHRLANIPHGLLGQGTLIPAAEARTWDWKKHLTVWEVQLAQDLTAHNLHAWMDVMAEADKKKKLAAKKVEMAQATADAGKGAEEAKTKLSKFKGVPGPK